MMDNDYDQHIRRLIRYRNLMIRNMIGATILIAASVILLYGQLTGALYGVKGLLLSILVFTCAVANRYWFLQDRKKAPFRQ